MVPDRDDKIADSPSRPMRRQFSFCPLLVSTATIVLLLGIAAALGEWGFWLAVSVVVVVASIAAWKHLSEIGRLLAGLMLFQFIGAAFVQPGDEGAWFCTMCRLYLAVDIFLFGRLWLFYKIAQRPEPRLPWLTKAAIITSPVYIAVVATYLMEAYGIFR